MNALVGSTLSDYFSTVRCLCERSFLRTLQGGCQVPIGATTTLTEVEGGNQLLLKINGIVLGLDGQKWVEGNGKYSKRRRSNVAVIIVKIVFYKFIPLLLSSLKS